MDVKFFQSNDGGEIECVNGVITLEEGLESASLLSLFGGCDDDDATDGTQSLQFWGNVLEEDGSPRQVRSRFQALTLTMPLNSATLQEFQEAAAADLDWLVEGEVVDSFTVETSIAGPKKLALSGEFNVRNDVYPFTFQTKLSDQE
jgi:phage gp46-like protein